MIYASDSSNVRGSLVIWILILLTGTFFLISVPNRELFEIGGFLAITALVWKHIRLRHLTVCLIVSLGLLLFYLLQGLFHQQSIYISDFGLRVMLFLNMAIVSSAYFKNQAPLTLFLLFERAMAIIIAYGFLSYAFNWIFPSNNVLFYQIDQESAYVGKTILFPQRALIAYTGEVSVLNENTNFRLRGHSIFWEPGNYAVFLTLSIINQMLIFRNWRRVIITAIALLLTFSTNAAVGFFSASVFLFFLQVKLRRPIFVIAGFVVLVAGTPVIYNVLFEKVVYTGSGLVRIANTLNLFSVILENPVLGTGTNFEYYTELLNRNFNGFERILTNEFSEASVTGASSTNGILKFGAMFGIFNFALIMNGIFRNVWVDRRYRWAYFITICLTLSSAPIFISPWFIFYATAFFWYKLS